MENKVLKIDRKGLSGSDNEDGVMSDVTDAQARMHLAWPDLERRVCVEDTLYRAWLFMRPIVQPRISRKFTLRRVRSIHEGNARRIDGAEFDALDLAIIKEAHNEQERLRTRLALLDERIAAFDAKMAEQAMATEVARVRRHGGGDTAGNGGDI